MDDGVVGVNVKRTRILENASILHTGGAQGAGHLSSTNGNVTLHKLTQPELNSVSFNLKQVAVKLCKNMPQIDHKIWHALVTRTPTDPLTWKQIDKPPRPSNFAIWAGIGSRDLPSDAIGIVKDLLP